MTAAEQEYADALAAAIVASLRHDPVPGDLVRLVVRWFEGADYLTIHALGSDEEQGVPNDDAWYPLEWPNVDREIARVDEVMADEALVGAIERVAGDVGEGGWSWEEQPPPLIAAGQQIHALLEADGIPLAPHFAVAVCHFEGWGFEESVPRANPETVLERLAERDLLPR